MQLGLIRQQQAAGAARHLVYGVSQTTRKQVEEILGWMMTVGGGFPRLGLGVLSSPGWPGTLVAVALRHRKPVDTQSAMQ